jgi:hypothetical protein
MGRARKKQQPDEVSSLDRVYGLREVNEATNDNDEGDALVDELHEDTWRTPISDSMVVRKAKDPRCNSARVVPFQRHVELPSVKPGGWWTLITPDRDGPIVDSQTGLDVRTVDDLTPDQPHRMKVDEAYVRAILEWASEHMCFVRPPLDENTAMLDVRRSLRHLVEDCDLPLDLKALVDDEYPILWTALRYVVEYDIDDQKRKPPEEPIRALTDAEREIFRTHDRLVVSLAAKLSRGYKGFNHDRFADLMYVGLEEMAKRIPRYNPARKVTIGAYLKPFIYGAMEERNETRLPTSSMAHTNDIKQLVDENIDRWKLYDGLDELDYISAHKRLVAAEKKAGKRKARTQARAKPKPEPNIPVASGNTVGQFTAQQYQVYLNLHEPKHKRFNQTEMAQRIIKQDGTTGVSRARYRQLLTEVNRICRSNLL